jgi:hypothetical protein
MKSVAQRIEQATRQSWGEMALLQSIVGSSDGALMPCQWQTAHKKEPDHVNERRLWLAILEDSIRRYQNFAAGKRSNETERRELMEWFSSDIDYPGSFVFVCGVFELNSGVVRTRLFAGEVQLIPRHNLQPVSRVNLRDRRNGRSRRMAIVR